MGDWKETYADLGFYIFPIAKGTKVPPAGFAWRERSSKNPLDWDRWEQEYLGCSWAVDCGKSGFIVIDIDKNDDKKGANSWTALLQELNLYPETQLVARSARGGEHRFYKGVSGTKNGWRSGIDVKSDGGYVLIAPSTFDGKPYQFVCDGPANVIPSDLFALLPKQESAEFSHLRPRPKLAKGERVKEGTRDEDLFTELSWAYLKDGLSVDQLYLHAIAFDAEHYGLGERIARRKAKSVTERYEPSGKEKIDPYYLPQNDDGNAQRLWNWFGEDFIFTNLGWYEWTGKFWKGKSEGRILTRSAQAFQELKNEAKKKEAAGPDEKAMEMAKKTTSFFNQCCNLARLKNMIALAEQRFFQEEKILDANVDLLNFDNGTVNLRTGVMHQHDRKNFITKTTGYELRTDGDCPAFKNLIFDAMGHDDSKALFLIQMLGSSLSGCVKDEIILLNHGAGSNGKSTLFGHVMLKVMGDYGRTVNVKSFLDSHSSRGIGPRPDLVSLFGVRYATMSEPPVGASFDEALLKSFTAGEPISCRDLHKSEISFNPTMHMFMSYNLEPRLKDFSDGMRRRLKKLEWSVQFEKNEAFKAQLDAEIPFIANFLVQACTAWYELGLEIPAAVSQATDNYFYEENPVAQFVDMYLDVSDGTSISNGEIWTCWERACEEQGWDERTKKYLSANLSILGFSQTPSRSQGRRWERLSVKNRPLGTQNWTD